MSPTAASLTEIPFFLVLGATAVDAAAPAAPPIDIPAPGASPWLVQPPPAAAPPLAAPLLADEATAAVPEEGAAGFDGSDGVPAGSMPVFTPRSEVNE